MAIETAGPFGPETFSFLRELVCCLKQATGGAKSPTCGNTRPEMLLQ